MLASLVTNKSAGRGSEITLRAEELLMNEGAGVKAVVAWAAKTAKAKERTNMMRLIVNMRELGILLVNRWTQDKQICRSSKLLTVDRIGDQERSIFKFYS